MADRLEYEERVIVTEGMWDGLAEAAGSIGHEMKKWGELTDEMQIAIVQGFAATVSNIFIFATTEMK